MVEAHPATGSPKQSFLMMINSRIKKEHMVMKIPLQDAILRGASEKLMIPLMAYRTNFQKLHFVSPAIRSTFS